MITRVLPLVRVRVRVSMRVGSIVIYVVDDEKSVNSNPDVEQEMGSTHTSPISGNRLLAWSGLTDTHCEFRLHE